LTLAIPTPPRNGRTSEGGRGYPVQEVRSERKTYSPQAKGQLPAARGAIFKREDGTLAERERGRKEGGKKTKTSCPALFLAEKRKGGKISPLGNTLHIRGLWDTSKKSAYPDH